MAELTGYARAPFVGHEPAVARAHARLEQAGAGRGSLLLVAGEPGIGKSRFADELLAEAGGRGWITATGRCYEFEGSPPYGPLVEAIHQLLRGVDQARLAAIAWSAGPEIALLLRELRPLVPDALPPASEVDRFRLFESVSHLLLALADECQVGLAIVLDDLHWADTATLRLVLPLARQVDGHRLLLVGTYRSTEVERGTPIASALAELRRERLAETLQLEPLDLADTACLVAALASAVSDSVAVAIASRTAGNPFFIEELVLHLAASRALDAPPDGWSVPEGVRAVVGERVARLGQDTLAALEAAAVLGDPIGPTEFAALLDWSSERLDAALERALRAGLLRDDGGVYRFSHALVGSALLQDLAGPRRRAIHRRAAQVIEQHRRGADVPAAIARHLLAAGHADVLPSAASWARRAGEAALSILAYEVAAHWFERALAASEAIDLSSTERSTLLVQLGEARRHAGQLQQAMAAFRRATGLDDGPVGVRAALGYEEAFLATGQARTGRHDVSVQLLEAAARKAVEPELRSRVLASLARALFYAGEHAAATACADEAVAIARQSALDAPLALALNAKRTVMAGPDQTPAQVAVASEICAIGSRVGDEDTALEGLYWRIFGQVELGQLDGARAGIAEYRRRAEALRRPRLQAYAHFLIAMLRLVDGNWQQAEAEADEGLRLGRYAEYGHAAVHWLVQLLPIRFEQDRLADLAQEFLGQLADQRHLPTRRVLYALLLSEVGQTAEARIELDVLATTGFAVLPRDHAWLAMLYYLGQVVRTLRDVDNARALYRLLEPYAGRLINSHNTVCYGSVDRVLGQLAATAGDRLAAAAHFERALTIAASIGAPVDHARAAEALGRLLVEHADGDERGRALLGQAVAAYERLGMLRSARELRAIHQPAPPRPRPAGLTGREIEVLRLIASGLTNRAIGEELVLSERTVERHITNAYTKIGARGKADATAFALRHGLLDHTPAI